MTTLNASSVGTILDGRPEGSRALSTWTCSPLDSLRRVLDRLVCVERKCMFVVDEKRACIGVVGQLTQY